MTKQHTNPRRGSEHPMTTQLPAYWPPQHKDVWLIADGRIVTTYRMGNRVVANEKQGDIPFSVTELGFTGAELLSRVDTCLDLTCCTTCTHSGEHHDAGECWVNGDNTVGEQQCPCGEYAPAEAAHRHVNAGVAR